MAELARVGKNRKVRKTANLNRSSCAAEVEDLEEDDRGEEGGVVGETGGTFGVSSRNRKRNGGENEHGGEVRDDLREVLLADDGDDEDDDEHLQGGRSSQKTGKMRVEKREMKEKRRSNAR
jgi:hypothetical protein